MSQNKSKNVKKVQQSLFLPDVLSRGTKHFTKDGHKNIFLQEEFWLLTVVCLGITVTDCSALFL